MEIEDAAKTVESPQTVARKDEIQSVLDSAFAGDAQRTALGEASLRAIDRGIEVLRSFGIELEVRLVKVEPAKILARPVESGKSPVESGKSGRK